MLPCGTHITSTVYYSTPFLGWIYEDTDLAQHLATADEELDELDHDLSHLSEW